MAGWRDLVSGHGGEDPNGRPGVERHHGGGPCDAHHEHPGAAEVDREHGEHRGSELPPAVLEHDECEEGGEEEAREYREDDDERAAARQQVLHQGYSLVVCPDHFLNDAAEREERYFLNRKVNVEQNPQRDTELDPDHTPDAWFALGMPLPVFLVE